MFVAGWLLDYRTDSESPPSKLLRPKTDAFLKNYTAASFKGGGGVTRS